MAAEIYYQNSCQSRFSGVFISNSRVFKEREFMEMLAVSYFHFTGVYLVFEVLFFSQKTREGCGCFRGLFGGSGAKLNIPES